MADFETFQTTASGRWEWRLKNDEGKVVRSSSPETYDSEAAAQRGFFESMARSSPKATGDGPDWSKGLLALAAGLVVAVLAALGITGDLLTRMVRNSPGAVVAPVIVLLVLGAIGGVVAAIASDSHVAIRWFVGLASVAVAGTLIWIAALGAQSQDDRELPSVQLHLERSDGGGLSLRASASGTSLRSEDKMLLQVIELTKPIDDFGLFRAVCTDALNVVEQPIVDYGRENVKVLAFDEVGPDSTGVASTEIAMPLDASASASSQFCALTQLASHEGKTHAQFAWVGLNGPLGEPHPATT